ncbi:MAG: hypothetical protein M0017_08000 [Desulfobacteraceae bacterium]|nr:hypothetical protein [Desulfobacteraceae bacterium]
MKRKLLTTLSAASLCLVPLAAGAQTAQQGGQAQFQAFQKAQQQHWTKTADQRQQVMIKQHELAATILNPKSTEEELLKKQRELQDARDGLEREQLTFEYQMKKKYPEIMESYGMMGYGMGRGYGMGPGMMGGYGMAPGMMGYGLAPRWPGSGQGPMGPGMMGGRGPGMMQDQGGMMGPGSPGGQGMPQGQGQ